MATPAPDRITVALTGTPGVGKTTVAAVAAAKGWMVIDLKAWARKEGCVIAYDAQDQADVIDLDQLATRMPTGSRILIEGHLSHLLPVDLAWVIRCDPAILRPRLAARSYPGAKVHENLEAEALDLILSEAMDSVPRVVQRDGTRRSPLELFQAFADAGLAGAKGEDLEAVDWSERLPID